MQGIDWNAAYYKKNSHFQEAAALKALNDYQFRGDEVVLDLGCGDGKITKEIAARVPRGRVVGIDASFNMIQEARKDFSHLSIIDWMQVRGEDFNGDDAFDTVFSFFAVHHIDDKLKTFKNIYKSLKNGGTFTFLVPDRRPGGMDTIINREPWRSMMPQTLHDKFYEGTYATYQKLILAAGFEACVIDRRVYNRTYVNREEFFKSTYAWVPAFTRFSSDEDNIRFSWEVVDYFARGEGEQITSKLPSLCIKATRLSGVHDV